MTAIEVIRTAMAMSEKSTMSLIEDMRDAPLTQPTSRGGNHPLWVLGHITDVEGRVPKILLGEENPVEHWAPLFAAGSEPTVDPSLYPPFDVLLRNYRQLRDRNTTLLNEIGESGLDRPTKAPPKGLEQVMATAGQVFLVTALHQMNHRGQLADARRSAGRKPMFTPA